MVCDEYDNSKKGGSPLLPVSPTSSVKVWQQFHLILNAKIQFTWKLKKTQANWSKTAASKYSILFSTRSIDLVRKKYFQGLSASFHESGTTRSEAFSWNSTLKTWLNFHRVFASIFACYVYCLPQQGYHLAGPSSFLIPVSCYVRSLCNILKKIGRGSWGA